MGHWVTLDDDQHVYISDGGKVLATRGAISGAAKGRGTANRLAKATAIHAKRAAAAKVLGTWQGVRGEGDIKLYHGTSLANVKGIRSEGLRNFGAKGYSMLSTNKATALDAANAKGSGVVLEYRVPGRVASRYLERGQRTTGIRGGKDVYAAVKPENPLPGKYVKGAQVPKSTIEKAGAEKVKEALAKTQRGTLERQTQAKQLRTTRAIEHAKAAKPRKKS